MFVRAWRPIVAASLLLALVVPSVAAHAEMTEAVPAPDSTVEGSPSEIVTWFTQNLDMSRTSLEVLDADGATVAEGGTLADDDPRELSLAVPPLDPGAYEVRWTSFSAEDGELARGSFSFTIVAAPTPSPSPTPTPSQPSTGPAATPTATPTPVATVPASAVPSATPTPTPPPGDASDTAILVPILFAAVVVFGLGIWIVRRR